MKIIICDDDDTIVNSLCHLILEQYPSFEVTGVTNSAQLSAHLSLEQSIDLIFMDIMLKEEDGIQLAASIQEKYSSTKMVYITGYMDKTQEIFFTTHPFGIIQKPIDSKLLFRYIEMAFQETSPLPSCFNFSFRKINHQIPFSNILYFESTRNKTTLHSTEGEFSISQKITEIEEQCPSYFIRCHQSFLVNPKHTVRFSGNDLHMSCGTQIPVSRSKKDSTEKKYFLFKGGLL